MSEISTTGDQMLAVLLAIARRGPLTAMGIASTLNINRTVAHRLVTTLHQRAFVRRQRDGYVIGPIVVHLAQSVEPVLRRAAEPVLRGLADSTGETAVLHTVDGDDAVVLEQAVSDRHVLRVQHQPGSRHQLAIGASGRALLAFQPPAFVESALSRIADATAVRRQVALIRRYGYAASAGELQTGVHGIAAPVLGADGYARASVALLAPADRARALSAHAGRLRSAAAEIAGALTMQG